MPTCDVCSDRINGVRQFICTHCGGAYCTAHRVPESHGCLYSDYLSSPWNSKLDEAHKYGPTIGRGSENTNTEHGDLTTSTHAETMGVQQDSRRHHSVDSYPVQRQTDPIPAEETAPGGKQHRDWEPDSKSPDVRPDGSLEGDIVEIQRTDPNNQAIYRRIILAIAAIAIVVTLYLL